MASWKPELYNADEVLAYYSNADAVQYRVYAGTKPDPAYLRYAFDETDIGMKQEGEAILSDALRKILSSPQNTNPYLLEIVIRPKARGQKKPVTTNITFQLNSLPSFLPGAGMAGMYPQQTDPALLAVLKGITEQNNLIISKLSADDPANDLADNDLDDIGAVNNPLMGMLNSPQIQGVLANALAGFLSKTLNIESSKPGAVLNGISDDKIAPAIEILKQHDPEIGESLYKLAMMAQNDPANFKMLLSMLKNM